MLLKCIVCVGWGKTRWLEFKLKHISNNNNEKTWKILPCGDPASSAADCKCEFNPGMKHRKVSFES